MCRVGDYTVTCLNSTMYFKHYLCTWFHLKSILSTGPTLSKSPEQILLRDCGLQESQCRKKDEGRNCSKLKETEVHDLREDPLLEKRL